MSVQGKVLGDAVAYPFIKILIDSLKYFNEEFFRKNGCGRRKKSIFLITFLIYRAF